jgi:hypothetical protein
MKKTFCAATLLLFAFVSGTMAFPPPGFKPVQETKAQFSGVVEKVDITGNVVVVRGMNIKEEKILTFAIDSKTVIKKGELTLQMKDVKRAMQVTVEYKEEKDNRLSALSIEVSGK